MTLAVPMDSLRPLRVPRIAASHRFYRNEPLRE